MNSPEFYLKKIIKSLFLAALAAGIGYGLSGYLDIPKMILPLILAGLPAGWSFFTQTFGHWFSLSPLRMVMLMLFKLGISIVLGWLIFPLLLSMDIRNLIQAQKS